MLLSNHKTHDTMFERQLIDSS